MSGPDQEGQKWDRVDNRREHPRLRCAGTAEVHFFPAGIKSLGKVIDLSLGGCCIEVEEPIEEERGTCTEVYFCVMGNTVQVAGVLCNVRNQVWAGIQFSAMSQRKAGQIQELIEELFAGSTPG
ncbi:MAG: PilZ domain-containing protein [Terracidiphilus sp.]